MFTLGDDTGTAAGDKEDVEIAEDMTEDEEEEDDVMVIKLWFVDHRDCSVAPTFFFVCIYFLHPLPPSQ